MYFWFLISFPSPYFHFLFPFIPYFSLVLSYPLILFHIIKWFKWANFTITITATLLTLPSILISSSFLLFFISSLHSFFLSFFLFFAYTLSLKFQTLSLSSLFFFSNLFSSLYIASSIFKNFIKLIMRFFFFYITSK